MQHENNSGSLLILNSCIVQFVINKLILNCPCWTGLDWLVKVNIVTVCVPIEKQINKTFQTVVAHANVIKIQNRVRCCTLHIFCWTEYRLVHYILHMQWVVNNMLVWTGHWLVGIVASPSLDLRLRCWRFERVLCMPPIQNAVDLRSKDLLR